MYNRKFAVRFQEEQYQALRKLAYEQESSKGEVIRAMVELVATRPELRALLNVEKGASDESGQQ